MLFIVSIVSKKNKGTILYKCGKKLGGLTALQEKDAQVTIEDGTQWIG